MARNRLLVVYRDSLLVAHVGKELEERHFEEAGRDELLRATRNGRLLHLNEINNIRSRVTEDSTAWTVLIETRGKSHSYQFTNEDFHHLRIALHDLLGDRFLLDTRVTLRLAGFAVRWFSVAGACFAVTAIITRISEVAAIVFAVPALLILSAVAIQRVLWAVFGLRRFLRMPRGLVPRRRVPLRAPILGKALKLLAFLWLVYVLEGRLARSIGIVNESLAMLLLATPGLIILQVGHRLGLRPLSAGKVAKEGSPVLLLRSFRDDDQVSLQPSGVLGFFEGSRGWRRNRRINISAVSRWTADYTFVNPARILRLLGNAPVDSAEEVLEAFCRRLGPLVAVGRPGELLATSGAARMYVSNDEWQSVVRDYLAKSQAVIVQPGSSPGVWWEMEEALGRVEPQRLLMSLASFIASAGAYESLSVRVQRRFGIRMPRSVPFRRDPCFVRFDDRRELILMPLVYRSGWARALCGDATDLTATLSDFTAGLSGAQPAARPKRVRNTLRDSLIAAVLVHAVGWGAGLFAIVAVRLFAVSVGWTTQGAKSVGDFGTPQHQSFELGDGVAALSIGDKWSLVKGQGSEVSFVLPTMFIGLQSLSGGIDTESLVERARQSIIRATRATDVKVIAPLSRALHGEERWYEATLEFTPPLSSKRRHFVSARRHQAGSLLVNAMWEAADHHAEMAVAAAVSSLRFTPARMMELQQGKRLTRRGERIPWQLSLPTGLGEQRLSQAGSRLFTAIDCHLSVGVTEAEDNGEDLTGVAKERMDVWLEAERPGFPDMTGIIHDSRSGRLDGYDSWAYEVEFTYADSFGSWLLGIVVRVDGQLLVVEAKGLGEDAAYVAFLRKMIGSLRITR